MVSNATIKSKPVNTDTILEAGQVSKAFPGVKATEKLIMKAATQKTRELQADRSRL